MNGTVLKPTFEKSGRHRFMRLGIGAAVIAALFCCLSWWWLFGSENSHDTRTTYFTVYPGETAYTIAHRLAEAHLIHTALGFVFLSEQRHWANRLRPGTYQLRPSDTPFRILAQMVGGYTINQISVPQGIRASEVIARLLAHHIGTRAAFANLAKHPLPGMPRTLPRVRNAFEGYLYPATYAVARGSSASAAIALMWDTFQKETRALRRDLPKDWTLRRWVTLASIVQAEVRYPGDAA